MADAVTLNDLLLKMEESLEAMGQLKDGFGRLLQSHKVFKQSLTEYFDEINNEDVESLPRGEDARN